MDRELRFPEVLKYVPVAELQALRVRVSAVRSADLVPGGDVYASLPRPDPGVVLGTLPRGDAYSGISVVQFQR